MNNLKVAQFVFGNHSFRIGALHWLAACNDGETFPSELHDAIEDGNVMEAFAPLPEHIEDAGVEEITDWLVSTRRFGFLARVETPTPLEAHENGYSTAGWGMHSNHWIYAETLDELLVKAASVSDDYIRRKLERLRKADKAA